MAGTIATVKFLFNSFGRVISPLGFSFDGFLEWFFGPQTELMRRVHIEPANSLNYTRRYLDALLKYLKNVDSRSEVLKVARDGMDFRYIQFAI